MNSTYLERADLAWLELEDETLDNFHLGGTFSKIHKVDELISAYEFMKIITKPDYIHCICQEILGIKLLPIQNVMIQELWKRKFPMLIASRGFGKSFSLAILCILKSLLIPGTKVVITGAGFRQAKLVYEYVENIWNKSDILRDVCSDESGSHKDNDKWTFKINDSQIIAIPMGTGDKIRGLRANIIVAEEFNTLEPSIYETVVQGFAAVRADPQDQVKLAFRRERLIKEGRWTEEQQEMFQGVLGNQSIISGTAGYEFEHFAQYWKRYKSIIHGDKASLTELVGADMVDQFDPNDYSVIRIPYELIPKGFMDDKQITRAKATVHSGVFLSEYGAVFVKDSQGFFRRTLIESCVAKESNKISDTKGNIITFDVTLKATPGLKYVIGVDPAASRDNLAIVVIELHDDHWRIVYCWTTNEKEHQEQFRKGGTQQENYYGYCARKIRDLMLTYPTVRIGIDGQGGGKAIIEALHDKSVMTIGEEQLWPVIDPDKEQDSDDKRGAHIIEKVEFADAKWTSEANHGMKKDMEMKYLLFPRYDGLSLSLAATEDMEKLAKGINFESIEGIIAEIEELKNELSVITMTQTTQSERDKWDTPEVKEGTGKKGHLKKDRYSALVIANMIARTMSRSEPAMVYAFIGGTSKELAAGKRTDHNPFEGNTWYNVDHNIFTAVQTKHK